MNASACGHPKNPTSEEMVKSYKKKSEILQKTNPVESDNSIIDKI